MSTEGPRTAGTGASVTGIGTVAWTNPGNITAIDDTRATASLSAGGAAVITNWLKATNFGFTTIADADTVTGITVVWQVSKTNDTGTPAISDHAARLVVADTIKTADKASGTAWTTTDADISHGGSADTWGETLTGADVKLSTFGAALSAQNTATFTVGTARVDSCTITVDYTAAGGGQPARTMHETRQVCF